MEMRSLVLIFALLCVAGIQSEVSDEQKSSDASEVVTDGDSSYLNSFAAELLKLLEEGKKMDGLSNYTDIHQKVDYAKTFLLSEKENLTNNPDVQKTLEAKITMIETLSKFMNSSHGNTQKEKLENLNGDFAWSDPTKMKNLVANDTMLLEDHSLNQSQNAQNLLEITFPPSTELFGSTTNENMPLKNDFLNHSRNAKNLVETTFLPPSELFGENETTIQTVFSTDSEYMKDQLTPIANNNLDERLFTNLLGGLVPKSNVNLSHFNITNASHIFPFRPIGKLSRRDEKQVFLDSNKNPDNKTKKLGMLFDIWKTLLEEVDHEKGLDKNEFLNLSSSTSVTGMEMNMTDPTLHQSEFDESISSTLEISNMSYSITELSTVVNDVNSTMFNTSHKVNTLEKMIFPSGNVSSKINTFDFIKDIGKRTGREKDIEDRFLNALENNTDHFTKKSFENSSDSTFNDTKITFKKQYPWIENISSRFTEDSKEASSFIGFENKGFQSQLDLESNTERNVPKWNLPTKKTELANETEDDFQNFQGTILILPNKLTREGNNSLIKQFSAIILAENLLRIFEMNYTLDTDRALTVDPSGDPSAKSGDSTINRKMEEKLGEIAKIQTPFGNLEALGHQNKPINNTLVYLDRNVKPENMEQKFWNENSQSLLNEMKSFSRRHSNNIPHVHSSIRIEYNKYISDKYAEEVDKGDLMNSQVEYNPKNGTNQLVEGKRSEEKD